MKILIIQTAFIGDVILATPVISELNRLYPDAAIDVLVRKGNESLLENNIAIRSVLSWEKKNDKNRQLLNTLQRIRKNKYDVVINLQRFLSTGLLTAFSGAKIKIGFKKNPLSFLFTSRITHKIGGDYAFEHEVTRNLKLIHHFGASQFARPSLFPSNEDKQYIMPLTHEPYFCFAPTSVWFTKQMPSAKWIELIGHIQKNYPGAICYLLGGPVDRSSCEKIKSALTSGAIVNLAGKLTFLQTAELMKDAIMNYVNDSAPLHIASAMNAPVTVFYCSTIPAFGFGPLSDKQKIIEVSGLDCRPCGLHGHKKCPQGHFKCGFNLNLIAALP